MGKNLKGKECGKGICQRKDGLYFARFYAKNGARQNGYFKTLPEAKKWLADAKYEDTHNLIVTAPDMTVDKWFNYWIDNIICDLAPNTIRNYRERYERNIQPLIGTMCIADVKPMHCKAVLNRMETEYAGSTIRQTYISMGTMFKSAVMNDIIAKHPMNGVRYTKPVRAVDDIKYLTVEEQEKFLEAAERSHNYRQYALLLETGLRTAELIGLTWDAIDWKKRTLTVNKSLEYRHSRRYWRAGPPKTKKSYRTIPLTERAYTILKTVSYSSTDLCTNPCSSIKYPSLPYVLQFLPYHQRCWLPSIYPYSRFQCGFQRLQALRLSRSLQILLKQRGEGYGPACLLHRWRRFPTGNVKTYVLRCW